MSARIGLSISKFSSCNGSTESELAEVMQSLGAQEERARSAAAQIGALEAEQSESRSREARL
eukprot:COSAG01_NODE_71141_length_256_cov_9.496815_2_plen_61_part_01